LQSEAVKPRLKKSPKTSWFDSDTSFTWASVIDSLVRVLQQRFAAIHIGL